MKAKKYNDNIKYMFLMISFMHDRMLFFSFVASFLFHYCSAINFIVICGNLWLLIVLIIAVADSCLLWWFYTWLTVVCFLLSHHFLNMLIFISTLWLSFILIIVVVDVCLLCVGCSCPSLDSRLVCYRSSVMVACSLSLSPVLPPNTS